MAVSEYRVQPMYTKTNISMKEEYTMIMSHCNRFPDVDFDELLLLGKI